MSSATPPAPATLADHAEAIRVLGKRVIGDVIEIGRRLTEAKKIAGHGNWLPWLEREFGWKDDTALNFMRIHEMAKNRNFRDLSLPVSGLYLLAAPSTPDEARDAIIERAETGEKMTHAKVKEMVGQAKNPPTVTDVETVTTSIDTKPASKPKPKPKPETVTLGKQQQNEPTKAALLTAHHFITHAGALLDFLEEAKPETVAAIARVLVMAENNSARKDIRALRNWLNNLLVRAELMADPGRSNHAIAAAVDGHEEADAQAAAFDKLLAMSKAESAKKAQNAVQALVAAATPPESKTSTVADYPDIPACLDRRPAIAKAEAVG